MAKTKIKVVEHVKSPSGKQIAIPKVEMGYGNILTSCEQEVYVTGIVSAGDLPGQYQVVAAAHKDSWIKVGDIVALDRAMFPYTTKPGKHDTGSVREVHVPEEIIDGRRYIYCTDRHVKWKKS